MKVSLDPSKRRRELLDRLLTPEGKPREGLETEKSLSSSDLAALFEMTERSIRKRAAEGQLPHTRTLGGGKLLYPAKDIAVLYSKLALNSGPQS